jgi:nitrite reductase/ring-hydroxylating ferredoxin subunit
MRAVHLGTVDVLLCNLDGMLVAYQDRCPHLANPLSEGALSDGVLTCAAHEWEFDARTGRGVNPASACLHRYPVRLDGEQIFVSVGEDEMSPSGDVGYGVGPVLHATPFARSVVSVIEEENADVLVRDEGAYLRVLAPRVCRLSRAGLEAATGLAIRFPGDLEVVMSSFTGVMQLTEDGAVWRLAGEPAAETAVPLAGDR